MRKKWVSYLEALNDELEAARRWCTAPDWCRYYCEYEAEVAVAIGNLPTRGIKSN